MDEIKDYILENQDKYKAMAAPHISRLRFLLGTEELVWHPDITIQFMDTVKSMIIDDVVENTACDYETCVVELESIDLFNFIGALDY
jgi:hypothetical protein